MRFQASFLLEASDPIYAYIFGPMRRYRRDGRTVLVTRAFHSLEHLRTLCGTLQSRMERAGRSFSGAVIQPSGTTPPTRPASYQNFRPLKVRLDYGLQEEAPVMPKLDEMRGPHQPIGVAAVDLEHPDTIVIPPNEFYPQGLTEQRVADYYEKMRDRLVSQYKEYELDGMVKLVADSGETVMKRHAMRLDAPEEFDKANRGRTIEFHFAVGTQTRMAWVDLDPKEEFPFEDVKDVAIDLAVEMGKALGDQVSVRFSGRSGLHVVALLPEPRDTKAVRQEVQKLVRQYIEQKNDSRLTDQFTEDPSQMRLDYSTLHATGGLRMPWSLAHPTGLICLPLSPDRVKMFRKEEATIDQAVLTQSAEVNDPVVLAAINTGINIANLLLMMEGGQSIPDDPHQVFELLKDIETAIRLAHQPEGYHKMATMLRVLTKRQPDQWPSRWKDITFDDTKEMFDRLESTFHELIMKRIRKAQAKEFDKEVEGGQGLEPAGASLEEYQQKREFDQTPEPRGEVAKKTEPVFVVQEHHAKKAGLHYDFRLAHEGVLKSWAVPKLKDLVTGGSQQVLAVEVEPHPLEYASFEGSLTEPCERVLLQPDFQVESSIPSGYGAGEVSVWDEGKYETLSQDEGHWKFRLHGGRLQGAFTLIHTAGNRWLLRRAKDAKPDSTES